MSAHPVPRSATASEPASPGRRTALLLGAAGVASIGLGSRPATAAATTTTQAQRSGAPRPADWNALRARLDGSLLRPGESGFASAHRLFNPRWDANAPTAVVRVANTPDVAEAVAFAQDHDLPVVVRGGGHSYTGASTRRGGLVIDLRSLDRVSLSGDVALIGGGAVLYPVKSALAARGRSIATGTCPTVGIGGLTLGGGIGVDSRRHGLTSDAVVGATVVTRGGETVRLDAASSGSLFWGLRGGGGGLGVVTGWRMRTHAARSVGVFSLTFPTSAARKVLTAWASWQAAAPRSVWVSAHVEARGSAGIRVRVVGVTAAGEEASRAESLVRAIGVAPSARSTRRLGHLESVRYLGGGTTSPRTAFAAGSDVIRVMTEGTATAIVGVMNRRARAGGTGAAILDPLDGAVTDVAADATAFPWRAHTASVQWYLGMPAGASSAQWRAAQSFIDSAHVSLGSRSRGGYLNYLETGRPLAEYLAGNTRRVTYLRGTYGVR